MPTRLLGSRSYIVACRVCVAGWFFGNRCGHQGSLPRSFAKGENLGIKSTPRGGAETFEGHDWWSAPLATTVFITFLPYNSIPYLMSNSDTKL